MNKIKEVRRYDYEGQITSIETTPQGFLKVPGFATRVGVFPYVDPTGTVRRELRHPDDVFAPESLVTLKNSVVTLEHPPTMITPENVDQYFVGYTTDRVDVNRDLVECDLIIADSDAIEAVSVEGVRELSSGYTADIEEQTGEYNGTPYDFRQTNIRYNHIAIVRQGRAGPEVRLRMDSADAVMQTPPAVQQARSNVSNGNAPDQGAKTRDIVIGGEKVNLPIRSANIIEDITDRFDLMRGQVAKLEESMGTRKDMDINIKGISPQLDVVQGIPDGRNAPAKIGAQEAQTPPNDDIVKTDADEDDKNKFQKKDAEPSANPNVNPVTSSDPSKDDLATTVDQLKQMILSLAARLTLPKENAVAADPVAAVKMDSAEFRKHVNARVKLMEIGKKILTPPTIARMDAMSDDEIKYAIIQNAYPKADLMGKSSTYIQVRFDSIVEAMETESDQQASAHHNMVGAGFLMNQRMDAQTDPRSARQRMIDESKSEWQKPLTAFKKI